MKAPNSKLQHPENNQAPSTKCAHAFCLMFDAWNFSGAWMLVLGAFIWCFSGAWMLEFGAFIYEP
jgi:hypothetical protein